MKKTFIPNGIRNWFSIFNMQLGKPFLIVQEINSFYVNVVVVAVAVVVVDMHK